MLVNTETNVSKINHFISFGVWDLLAGKKRRILKSSILGFNQQPNFGYVLK